MPGLSQGNGAQRLLAESQGEAWRENQWTNGKPETKGNPKGEPKGKPMGENEDREGTQGKTKGKTNGQVRENQGQCKAKVKTEG